MSDHNKKIKVTFETVHLADGTINLRIVRIEGSIRICATPGGQTHYVGELIPLSYIGSPEWNKTYEAIAVMEGRS